jgi:type IV secretion system protein VirB4
LHVGDLGHFAVFGPPGAGKSTLLNLLIAQHRRYPGAQIFGFDFGYSMYTLCEASRGVHYDIASDYQKIAFCPLAQIDTPADRSWAAEFIELLVTLRMKEGESLSVAQTNEIARAIDSLAKDTKYSRDRTITHFLGTVQDNSIKEALQLYTVGAGAIGDMLDSDEDALATNSNSKFFVFEMSHLFNLGDRGIIPVMMHIFRQIEKRVAKSIPTLIPIDEAFRSFGHPLAIARLNKWLELMRKENAAVGFATQNINTVLQSEIGSSILQTVASKFLLPNAEATTTEISPLYKKIGLNDRQIENLAYARPKRDYYLMNQDGRRMFDLGLGQIALAFVGVSGKEDAAKLREFKEKFGNKWVYHWLLDRGVPSDWANYYVKLKQENEQ